MRIMRSVQTRAFIIAGLILLCLLSGGPLRAQPARPSAVLSLPDGRIVEVLGLRRWTLAMLQDSLSRYAPGDSLHKHSCAATLRYKLGFADAAATTVEDRDRPLRTVVVLREPQDSARVRFRRLPEDTSPGRPDWRPVSALIQQRPVAYRLAVTALLEGDTVLAPGPHPGDPGDHAAAASALTFLRSRTGEADRRAALRALRESPNQLDRAVAALVLRNFGDRDDTWRALVEALREPDGYAKSAALLVAQRLPDRSDRPVEWWPVSDGIHAMLDGTSLGATTTVLQLLRQSGVRPTQARAFLRNGGELVLTYLASGTPMLTYSAHDLLVKLRGADLGPAPEPWRAWIATL
jgi:hypothetical protein